MGRRFAVRTVRHGSVVINGVTYRPDERHMKYDGRLDGKRFAFGLYHHSGGWRFVSLWGTEEEYQYQGDDWETKVFDQPHRVGISYPWEWWSAQLPEAQH